MMFSCSLYKEGRGRKQHGMINAGFGEDEKVADIIIRNDARVSKYQNYPRVKEMLFEEDKKNLLKQYFYNIRR